LFLFLFLTLFMLWFSTIFRENFQRANFQKKALDLEFNKLLFLHF
jgi:hypothetical protein